MTNATDELHDLSIYLSGLGDAWGANGAHDLGNKLLAAARWLEKTSRNTCGQGYIGCGAGRTCSGEHK